MTLDKFTIKAQEATPHNEMVSRPSNLFICWRAYSIKPRTS